MLEIREIFTTNDFCILNWQRKNGCFECGKSCSISCVFQLFFLWTLEKDCKISEIVSFEYSKVYFYRTIHAKVFEYSRKPVQAITGYYLSSFSKTKISVDDGFHMWILWWKATCMGLPSLLFLSKYFTYLLFLT